ncbi:MAG: MerR family transcriptional regulator [Hydrogenophaga sp.]|uniref:MerR family transcriptional regulator n=1 Tax=Hydrogenophaga crocea TaxID=2716225 RepID=A0A6G8IEP1_9BURK|nr:MULTISPECIES: MerR family transcriptional regulator [Hydrogenophaga]MBL0944001.1 MerR family transcriptional regulator [Hydrogenophaga sp.]QIM51674.1 MerR family transcriptional regulator [Hydrogenophaga crocea]
MENSLPPIPAKRYFTIGEVGELCGVKPHVLRYWEQEFTQLRPMKRRGNRRYYQHHEVLMIRRIRELLYEQGFTISGARNKLQELAQTERDEKRRRDDEDEAIDVIDLDAVIHEDDTVVVSATVAAPVVPTSLVSEVRRELLEIRELLRLTP